MNSQENVTPLGESEVFLRFNDLISKAAKVDRSILVIGERGTGKELAARKLHYLSPRWENPLITVNCAALPPSLIETELFGHESGAFTGAQKSRKGRFEEAEGGTLFLDEIGLIPLVVQEKILRVVEYGTFEKVGSSHSHKVDVRIIGATNADLKELCRQGKFKEDLLDRLSFEVLFLPPLRERGEDIILLANYFATRMGAECNKEEMPYFSNDLVEKLLNYSWPGNVRELKNVIERAVYRSSLPEITEIDFNPFDNPFLKKEEPKLDEPTKPLEESIKPIINKEEENGKLELKNFQINRRNLELEYLKQALDEGNGNQREAAKLLDLSYDQLRGLYRKFSKYL